MTKNVSVVVSGDMSSEKSSENYPTMTLCPDCLGNYQVVVEEGPSSDDCDECGEAS